MNIQSTTKRRKSHKQVTVEEMKDRISSLPNEILCHILSFLPTKYAVGTCILSTRWKYLWTSLPNLDFDDSLLFYKQRPASGREERLLSFTSFVDRVLILRNVSYIRKFRLSCFGKNYESSSVNTWICAALWCNVQELDLSINKIYSKVLPRSLFSCGTLVSLELFAPFVLDVPSSVCLPKLKTLHLESIIFQDNDSTRMLFSSCPVLEELCILSCECEKKGVFSISAPALKRLTIIHQCETCDDEYRFIIDAPSLEYIELFVKVGEVSLAKNIDSLIEADLRVDICCEGNYSVFELIRATSNVKVLRLSGYTMEAILSCHQELPVFPNLIDLELRVDMDDIGWQLLPEFLQQSPNLESLLCPIQGIGEFQWSILKQVPHCLLHHLKTIEIRDFRCRKEDMKVVKYFLKNAKVLQKMIIGIRRYNRLIGIHRYDRVSPLSEEEELKISSELLMFPWKSETCQVEFT